MPPPIGLDDAAATGESNITPSSEEFKTTKSELIDLNKADIEKEKQKW
jgi:hypothetical protein